MTNDDMEVIVPTVEGVRFKLLEGFTCYAVGDNGTIWTKCPGTRKYPVAWRMMTLYRRPYGTRYVVVCLHEDEGRGKIICRYVHRLVLEAFVGPPPTGMECLHRDGDTSNNTVSNLRWGTRAENIADQTRHKDLRS